VTEYGFELLALHRSGKGHDMFEIHLRDSALYEWATVGYSPAVAGTGTPSLAAIRRAVSARFAVMPADDWRARSRTTGGAVSGVPLLNGGSGA
jgi:hypothetical protein